MSEDLGFLYPGLGAGDAVPPEKLDAALLESTLDKALMSRETNERFFAGQGAILVRAAKALAESYRNGGRLFAMGNGGSSCDSAHVTVEFLHPITAGRPALAAVNLTADIAMVSAVGNDVGFEHIFVRQIVAHAQTGDALIGFSTSGNSANLLTAYVKAREMGMITIGFAGGDGGRMLASGLVDHCLVVPTSSIHRVQECHVVAYHILWDLTHTLLAGTRGPVS